jgi:DNA-binding MarR family transcriptional regulator
MTIAGLSEALGLDVSTLQRQTSAAMKDGVLNRIADPDGGIARKFVVSDQGQRTLHAERSRFVGALEGALADWSEAELATFAESLKRFNQSIEKAGALSWPRPETPRVSG